MLRVPIFGIAIVVWGRYLIFWHLDLRYRKDLGFLQGSRYPVIEDLGLKDNVEDLGPKSHSKHLLSALIPG